LINKEILLKTTISLEKHVINLVKILKKLKVILELVVEENKKQLIIMFGNIKNKYYI